MYELDDILKILDDYLPDYQKQIVIDYINSLIKLVRVDYTGVFIVKIDKLEKEIERLNNIIDKAIEYINRDDIEILIHEFNCIKPCKNYLINILKGEK